MSERLSGRGAALWYGTARAGDRAAPEAVIATQRCRLLPLNLCAPWRGQTASPQVAEKPGAPGCPACALPTGGSAPESHLKLGCGARCGPKAPRGPCLGGPLGGLAPEAP